MANAARILVPVILLTCVSACSHLSRGGSNAEPQRRDFSDTREVAAGVDTAKTPIGFDTTEHAEMAVPHSATARDVFGVIMDDATGIRTSIQMLVGYCRALPRILGFEDTAARATRVGVAASDTVQAVPSPVAPRDPVGRIPSSPDSGIVKRPSRPPVAPEVPGPPPPSKGAAYVMQSADRRGWVDVTTNQGGTERVTQAIVGEQVRILRSKNGWCLVESSDKTWAGWLPARALTSGASRFREAQPKGRRVVITAAPGFKCADGTNLPFGAVLPEVSDSKGTEASVVLPNGRVVSIPRSSLAAAGTLDLPSVLRLARGYRRVQYERGANTPEAMDGAGLVHVVFRVAGVPVPRDLDEQMRYGSSVKDVEVRPGDVLFFSTADPAFPQPAILLDGETFLEASPSSAVNIGFLEQKRNRRIVAIRRMM